MNQSHKQFFFQINGNNSVFDNEAAVNPPQASLPPATASKISNTVDLPDPLRP